MPWIFTSTTVCLQLFNLHVSSEAAWQGYTLSWSKVKDSYHCLGLKVCCVSPRSLQLHGACGARGCEAVEGDWEADSPPIDFECLEFLLCNCAEKRTQIYLTSKAAKSRQGYINAHMPLGDMSKSFLYIILKNILFPTKKQW